MLRISIGGFVTALVLLIARKFFVDIPLAYTIINYAMFGFLGIGVLFLLITIWKLLIGGFDDFFD